MLKVTQPYTLKIDGQHSVIFNMVHSQRVNGVCQNRNPEDDALGSDSDIYNIACEPSSSKLLLYTIIGTL
jgi:hypothetical protein